MSYGVTLFKLACGDHVPEATTTKYGFRRVGTRWLSEASSHVSRLETALAELLQAWESIPEDVQVPEEINVNELWDEVRNLLSRP